MVNEKRLLFLGYEDNRLIDFLRGEDYDIVNRTNKLSLKEIKEISPSEIVSYGYRHIIKPDVIAEYPKIVNLHIAYLPWNRGEFPNFWSWLQNAPKGFSIHYINEGIDTGDILIRRRIEGFFEEGETLSTSYEKLRIGIEDLFIENWKKIASGKLKQRPQDNSKGNHHYARELEDYKFLMADGWDTLIEGIRKYGKEHGLWLFDENGNEIK